MREYNKIGNSLESLFKKIISIMDETNIQCSCGFVGTISELLIESFDKMTSLNEMQCPNCHTREWYLVNI